MNQGKKALLGDKKFILLIVFIIFGAVITLQFRSTLYVKTQKTQNVLDTEKLVEQIDDEKNLEQLLKEQIDKNLTIKENYEKSFLEVNDDQDLLYKWEDIRLKANLTDVKGSGIIMILDDAPAKTEDNGLDQIIHDQDIKIILNELKKAGAQAISINNERIVAPSEQVCAGPTILINGNRYPVPYVINVIGEPDILYDTMINCERIQIMMEYMIRVDIKKSNSIVVPKYSYDPVNDITGLEVIKR